MNKFISYSLALATFAFALAACSKDQKTVKRLDGKWQMTAERISNNSAAYVTTPMTDLGDIKYEFTKCKQKKEGFCDGHITAIFGALNFQVPFGFRADDKGETLFIDEDKDETTTDDQHSATITTLDETKLSFTYSEVDGSNTKGYQYDFSRIED